MGAAAGEHDVSHGFRRRRVHDEQAQERPGNDSKADCDNVVITSSGKVVKAALPPNRSVIRK